MKRLATEMLQKFVGGQIEIQNPSKQYLYRGEIKTATIQGESTNKELRITLNWMAKGKGIGIFPTGWENAPDKLEYNLNLWGSSEVVEEYDLHRIRFQSPVSGETIVIFSPKGSRIDPTDVEGLELPTEKPQPTLLERIEEEERVFEEKNQYLPHLPELSTALQEEIIAQVPTNIVSEGIDAIKNFLSK